MNDYFQGAVKQHIERGRGLIGRIPTDLPVEFHALESTCKQESARILRELESVLGDPTMLRQENQPERLRRFRRALSDLAFLERTGILALERGRGDRFLYQLADRIRLEIHYPLLPPAVCALSQSYFRILPQFNLLFVPLSEGDFLLHLSDIYHEIAHPLLFEKYNPKVMPFQDAFFSAYGRVLEYILAEQQEEDRRSGRAPSSYVFYLRTWQRSWGEWLEELFCDLFATYTVGPAYGWSNFYLCSKLGSNPFAVPTTASTTHPADDARMRTILLGLEAIGFHEEVIKIGQKWRDLISITRTKPEAEYFRCFPDSILQEIAKQALIGVRSTGCQVVDQAQLPPIVGLLNRAWQEFWHAPSDYAKWERKCVDQLRAIVEN